MKFSEKSQKKRDQGFTSSLENTVLEKPKGKEGGGSGQLPPPPPPPPPTVLGLSFVKILNFSIERCLILMAFLEEMVICVTLVTFVTKDF